MCLISSQGLQVTDALLAMQASAKYCCCIYMEYGTESTSSPYIYKGAKIDYRPLHSTTKPPCMNPNVNKEI